jgi:hypothetical protein
VAPTKVDTLKIVTFRMLCATKASLNLVSDILDDAGEGCILRKVGSLYEHGRTPSLIKLKVGLQIFALNSCLFRQQMLIRRV